MCIRDSLCLDRTDIFRTQLRALIRASVYGRLCIMFPMIATVKEFCDAKAIYEEEKAKLIAEGVKAVSYTHLDVYKRQLSHRSVCCLVVP